MKWERGERWIDDESVVAFEHAGWGLNQILDTRKGSRNICDLILSFSLSGFSKILRPPTTFEFISIYSLCLLHIHMSIYIYRYTQTHHILTFIQLLWLLPTYVSLLFSLHLYASCHPTLLFFPSSSSSLQLILLHCPLLIACNCVY